MHKLRLLLGESDAVRIKQLRTALLRAGRPVEIISVTSRIAFHRIISTRKCDAIIVNALLGGQSTTDLVSFAHAIRPNCPSIVYSGFCDTDTVIDVMRAGGSDFLRYIELVAGDCVWERIDSGLLRVRQFELDRRRAQRRVRQLLREVETDPLTGLANRRVMDRLLVPNGHRVHERRGDTAIIILDIDHFKEINDSYGHDCGDFVLKAISREIVEYTGPSDTALRWGGEEFLIVRPETTMSQALYWGDGLRRKIDEMTMQFHGRQISISASFGICAAPSQLLSNEVITLADQALLLAKRRGRNRSCISSMVTIEQIADTIPKHETSSRLHAFLEATQYRLGPEQRFHLTTHSERVSLVATKIGHRLGLPADRIGQLAFAGLCHDLGKIYVPDRILAKPNKLLPDESFLIAQHAAEGASILQRMGVDEPVAESVRHHHDRFDGANVGERIATPCSAIQNRAISLEAQVLHVADSLTTMTSDLPYQRAQSTDSARQELVRQKGKQFSPAVVEAALNIVRVSN